MFIDSFLFKVNLIQIVYVWGGWLSFNTKCCYSHFTDLESSSPIAELLNAIDYVAELWSAVGDTLSIFC